MELGYDPPESFAAALDRLHETVSAAAGLTAFGPDDYLPVLRVLLQSMDYDPRFTEVGRRAAGVMLGGLLQSRAEAFAAMAASRKRTEGEVGENVAGHGGERDREDQDAAGA